jgi:hypothetical protein
MLKHVFLILRAVKEALETLYCYVDTIFMVVPAVDVQFQL